MLYRKTLLFKCKKPEKLRLLWLGLTAISAVNFGETTIHSALAIESGANLSDLSGKAKASLRNKFSEVKLASYDWWGIHGLQWFMDWHRCQVVGNFFSKYWVDICWCFRGSNW